MKLNSTLIAAVLIAASFSVSATNKTLPAAKKAVKHIAKEQTFKVDNQTSKIGWLAKKATGEHNGNIKISDGTFNVQNNVLKTANFSIDISTITDIDLTDPAQNDKLVSTLKSDTFFDSGKFPKADFVTTSIVKGSNQQYTITGKLTIKGITNEVSFPATVAVTNNKLTANAKLTIDRTKYDIKFRSKNFFENLGDKVIYDDFDLDISLVANAQ
ncbi:Polyisoprenoid-binding protein YceI [Mucilaginibacter mallensis]|uniref:Polyisoprenoid-binding protein YceI n=1 Tax=Mucilaginibacter mallensis TaxID=652787 RepID=A0A1H1ZLH3_MUCMA|nr:YceI family protein [Mucilaginibacter mallensis]SDT34524.1 Polyisoprenoid-binding protein YceI [Mucilaginibacter mallensis]